MTSASILNQVPYAIRMKTNDQIVATRFHFLQEIDMTHMEQVEGTRRINDSIVGLNETSE